MEAFERSCSRADHYPRNLINVDTPAYTVKAIEDQLDQRSTKLFCDEAAPSSRQRPSLSFFDSSVQGQALYENIVDASETDASTRLYFS